GAALSAARLELGVPGIDDAPLAVADAVTGDEDDDAVEGPALANDADVDSGTTLAVFTPGSLEGEYGTLTVDAGGAFIYALRGDDDDLHALREGETVFEHFTYAATDGAFISPADV